MKQSTANLVVAIISLLLYEAYMNAKLRFFVVDIHLHYIKLSLLEEKKKKLNVTLGIVGGVIGAIVGVVAVLVIMKCKQKRKCSKPEKSKLFRSHCKTKRGRRCTMHLLESHN